MAVAVSLLHGLREPHTFGAVLIHAYFQCCLTLPPLALMAPELAVPDC